MTTRSLHLAPPRVSVNGVESFDVAAVEIEYTPSTPTERLVWSVEDLNKAMQRLSFSAGLTAAEFGRLIDLLTVQFRQGSALLARHRRRRHR